MDLKLFAIEASHDFGARVASDLGVALAPHEEREFEDGEHKLRPLASVRGCDVYVVHSLYGDERQSANDKFVHLLFFAAGLCDAGAARITVVAPYLCYARKDRRTKAHDPLSSRYVAQLIEAVGIDRVVTMDVHNLAAYQNAFRINAEQLEAGPLFVSEIAALAGGDEAVVVAPDSGALKRAEALRVLLAARLGRPVGHALLEKHRSSGQVWGDLLVGDVRQCMAVIVDDMISSGTTLARAAQACRERGAVRVHAVATHGLFAVGADEVLTRMPVESILITDTIPAMRLSAAARSKLQVISTSGLFAAAIRQLHNEGPLPGLESSDA